MQMRKRLNMTAPDERLEVVLNQEAPRPLRAKVLQDLAAARDPASRRQLSLVLDLAAAGKHGEEDEKLQALDALLERMQAGPFRLARCVGMEVGLELPLTHVRVRSMDGTEFVSAVPDHALAGRLKRGSLVALDASGVAVMHVLDDQEMVGEIAHVERRVNGCLAEVSLRGEGRCTLLLTSRLREKLDAGDAGPGSRVIIDQKTGFAMDLVEHDEGQTHYMFLDRSPLPDTDPARDLGAPPAYIRDVIEHVRGELFNPEIRRAYDLPRTRSYMLVGPSGTGKSYSVQAVLRGIYGVMAERTGVPVEELPNRVFRLRMSEVLNCLLGESDKRLARLFDEALQLYDEGWAAPDGRRFELPVIIIGEEIDGLARRRGMDTDGVHDRILTTALQKFDPAGDPAYRDRLCLIFLTSNVPDILDAGFFRRAGSVQRFGRLTDRSAFKAVLGKHLGRVPLSGAKGSVRSSAAQRRAIEQVASCFFSRNGDTEALVGLQLVGGAAPMTRTYTDFLTPAMVAQAVHKAAAHACRDEIEEAGKGVRTEDVIRAIKNEVLSVVERLTEQNVGDHVDLPEGNRVSRVRRLVGHA